MYRNLQVLELESREFAGMEVAGTGICKYWNLQVLELVGMEFAGIWIWQVLEFASSENSIGTEFTSKEIAGMEI